MYIFNIDKKKQLNKTIKPIQGTIRAICCKQMVMADYCWFVQL